MPPTTAPIGPATTAPARAPPTEPGAVPPPDFFTSLVVVVTEPSAFSVVVVELWSWAKAMAGAMARAAQAAPIKRVVFISCFLQEDGVRRNKRGPRSHVPWLSHPATRSALRTRG